MALARLYVKSKRSTLITGQVSMESIGTAHTTTEYSEGSTITKLSREEQYARDLLKRSGVDFDLVDLSSGVVARLRARYLGVKSTPSLVDGGNPAKLYKGIGEITDYVKARANSTPTGSA